MSDDFAVRCRGCDFIWHTGTMAEGLRILGSCPRCNGALEFGSRAAAPLAAAERQVAAGAPHRVLGLPRR